MDAFAPLIVTLRLDPESFALFQHQRRDHFPPARNIVPAHLTLFHHLPGTRTGAVIDDLRRIARDTAPIPLDVVGLKSLGGGVAYQIRSQGLEALRQRLVDLWHEWLVPQDRAGFQPHVTVQNKAPAEKAKETLALLRSGFHPFTATGTGLLLWRYMGGPWQAEAEVAFRR